MKTINTTNGFIPDHKPSSRLFLPVLLTFAALIVQPVLAQTTNIIWTGTADNTWNATSGVLNWTTNGGGSVAYADGLGVTFNDSAPGSTSVNLTGTVLPGNVIITNNLLSYAFGGASGISGVTSLTKAGTNVLFLGTVNTFTNGVNLNGGTVVLGAAEGAANIGGPFGVTNATSPGLISFNGGTLQFSNTVNTFDYSRRFVKTGNQTFNIIVPNASAVTFASVIAGANTTFNVVGLKTNGATAAQSTTELILSSTNAFTVPAGVPITVSGGQFRDNTGVNSFNGNPIVELSDDSQIYFNVAGTYPSPLTIRGSGTIEADASQTRAGAMRLATANVILSGTITLSGPATIGSRGSAMTGATISGQITGPYGIRFNWSSFNAGVNNGSINLSNTNNNWTGDTMLGDGTLRLGASGVIPNGPGFGNMILTNAGNLYANGISNTIFDLNGFNQTINGLSHATNGIDPSQLLKMLILNNGSSPCSLTLGNNNASGNYAGRIINATNVLSLVKIGSGTQILSGTNTYTGSTTVNGGVLQLAGGGSIGNSTALILSNGTFGMNAAMNVSTASFTNGTLSVPRASVGSPNITAQTLNVGGPTNIIQVGNIPPIGIYPVTFPVIQYSTLNGNISTFGPSLPTGYFGYISNDVSGKLVDLVLTNGVVTPVINWFGASGGALNSTWDYATTDWTNILTHVAAAYSDNSLATFDDTGKTNVVNLTTAFAPLGLTINNSALNYTFTGTGAIGGTNGIIKQGGGTLLLDNGSANSFSGGLTISAGTLQVGNNDTNGSLGTGSIADNGSLVLVRTNNVLLANVISGSGSISQLGTNSTLVLSGANLFSGTVLVTNSGILQAGNASALGTTNSLTTIASGSALDINGFSLGARIAASGRGVLNNDGSTNGAVYSSAASSAGPPSVGSLTLLGDTVLGCPPSVTSVLSNRWDIRGVGASLSTGGNAYNLTKIGMNQISIVDTTVDPTLGNIDVQNGILSIEATTTGLGDPTKTLTVENGAILSFSGTTNLFNKKIVLNGNGQNNNLGTVNAGNGNNTIVGPVTFNGSVDVTYRSLAGLPAAGATLTLSNSITAIAGTGSLTKDDTNTLTVAGLDAHSGGTTINDGTFILNGMSTSAANTLTINSHTLTPNTILGGNGTNSGPVVVNDTFWPGVGGKPSTFGSGDFTISGTPTTTFSLGTANTVGGGVNDLLNVHGNLDANGVVVIHPIGLLTTNVTYTLINYTGTELDPFSGSPAVDSSFGTTRYAFAPLVQTGGHVQLTVVTGVGAMEWNGASGDGLWNVQGSQNWTNLNSPTLTTVDHEFLQLDTVLFDDSIITSGGTNVLTVTTNNVVLPTSITVNSTTNYVIAGRGSIGGTVNINKMGSSTLRIDNTNIFNGTTMISGGTLLVNNTNALGPVSSPVVVTNGGALDIGGPSLAANQAPLMGQKAVYISGMGPNSHTGTLINGGTTTEEDAFQNIIMTADAAIGCDGPLNGAGRFDIGRITPATFSTGGHAYNLYKVGTNQISLVALTVDTNLANVDIQGGELGLETATTGLGDPSKTVTVETGATLEFFALVAPLNKVIVVNGGATVQGTDPNLWFNSGASTVAGPVTVTNGIVVIGGSGTGTLSNSISGPGAVTIAGGVTLTVANTYTGNTVVSNNGTLFLTGSASINNSTNITIRPGGKLDVTGRVDTLLTLGGQTLTGGGTINGSLSNAVGSTVSVTSTNATGIGTLTVTTNVWLNGTTVMKLDKGNLTNDVLSAGGNVVYGGTLNLTNISLTPLAANDQFKLFRAGTYSGAFTITPATPGAGLLWDTSSLTINGTLKVVSSVVSQPHIGQISLNGTSLMISATGGSAGATYYLLQSANVAVPLSQWIPVFTNTYDGSGNTSTNIANLVNPLNLQVFYILSNTN